MGMFDSIAVKENNINLPLPQHGHYQTKWLDSNLCEIQIDVDGLMTCPAYNGCEHYPPGDVKELHLGNYTSDEFSFYGTDVNGLWHDFKAEVRNSRIVKLWSYDDLLFDKDRDSELDILPVKWTNDTSVCGARVTGVTLVRHRRLKDRRTIIQNYRTVKCSEVIDPDVDGLFKIDIDNRHLSATMHGKLLDNTIIIDTTVIRELKTPYLRKGFKKLAGYFIDARVTNA